MIISASRRTDIPNYYSEWFYNRIKEGFACVRNPMNPRQVSRIDLSPQAVDCIVFWTKNPAPMMERLGELAAYRYYFQFTLTGYGKHMEPGLPPKKEVLIPVFQRLSRRIGARRVIWRYDPILFNSVYTPEYHLRAFAQIAEALKGYTEKCVISFVDAYAKNRRALKALGAYELGGQPLLEFASKLSEIAGANGMTVGSCAEALDLAACGIAHNCCIDKELIEELVGYKLKAGKDKNQRPECGCAQSVEIGAYDTCRNGCLYCYANSSPASLEKACGQYDAASPLLCGHLTEADKITVRAMRSLAENI